jgi:transcriptional regulator with XRE-family HTH domain
MDVGKRIREIRDDYGMSRNELARRVGVAGNHLYQIEAGTRTPSLGLIERVARELHTEPADLLREPVGFAQGKAEAPEEGRSASRRIRFGALVPGGDGPRVSHKTLAHLGIEATDAELNALNTYLESSYRTPVDNSLRVIASWASDNVDHDKIKDWAAKVEASAPDLIALDLFAQAKPGGENVRFAWFVSFALDDIREAALRGRKNLDHMDATGASAGADPESRAALEEAIDEALRAVDRASARARQHA